ncbi:MAG: DUF4058 family protein [Armatimonadota bacterium]
MDEKPKWAENPFPGMNPYLEDSRLWSDLHRTFISVLRAQLNTMLPLNYLAFVEERVYIEEPATFRTIIPDAVIMRPMPGTTIPVGATAVADAPYKIYMQEDGMREPYIEIIALRNGQRKVVTIIELLSPTNKTPNSVGRKLYLEKQEEVIYSTTHLIEIDLLHYGAHTLFVPRALLEPEDKRLDYAVVLHKAGWCKKHAWAWPINLRERLPNITVPLAEGDPDVIVDLQAVLNRVYEEGRYGLALNYAEDPPVELPPDDLQWIDSLLREKGLR